MINKKYLNISIIYAIAAMIGGVFYREFTKFNGFTGVTMLGKVHPHLFLLGTFMFLIIALFDKRDNLKKAKSFRVFMFVYNIGLTLTVIMMIVRGVLEVLGTEISKGLNGAISGIAGMAHIILGIGIILLLVSFKFIADPKSPEKKKK